MPTVNVHALDLCNFVRSRADAPEGFAFWLRNTLAQGDDTESIPRVWAEIPRADWMLWLADVLDVSPALITTAKGAVAKVNVEYGRRLKEAQRNDKLPNFSLHEERASAVRALITGARIRAALHGRLPVQLPRAAPDVAQLAAAAENVAERRRKRAS